MATVDQHLISHENDVVGGHPDMDYAEHEATYRSFIAMAKWVPAAVVVLLIFLAWLWL